MTDLTTKPNAELAYRVLDVALAHDDHLDMDVWASAPGDVDEAIGLADLTGEKCGTFACYAGWTAAVLGYRLNSDGRVFGVDGEDPDIQVFAARRLGLTSDQAMELFHLTDEDELPARVAKIFGPRPEAGA